MLLIVGAITGCDRQSSQNPESVSPEQHNTETTATVNEFTTVPAKPPKVTEKPPKQPLNLSRSAISDNITQALRDPAPALPDLFKSVVDERRLSTSGRVLTDDTAGLTLDAIEGVEVSIEFKTN